MAIAGVSDEQVPVTNDKALQALSTLRARQLHRINTLIPQTKPQVDAPVRASTARSRYRRGVDQAQTKAKLLKTCKACSLCEFGSQQQAKPSRDTPQTFHHSNLRQLRDALSLGPTARLTQRQTSAAISQGQPQQGLCIPNHSPAHQGTALPSCRLKVKTCRQHGKKVLPLLSEQFQIHHDPRIRYSVADVKN